MGFNARRRKNKVRKFKGQRLRRIPARRGQKPKAQAYVSGVFVAHLARMFFTCMCLFTPFVGWCYVSHVGFPCVQAFFGPAVMPQYLVRSWYSRHR